MQRIEVNMSKVNARFQSSPLYWHNHDGHVRLSFVRL